MLHIIIPYFKFNNITSNNFGFRDKNFYKNNITKIAIIGDSYTYGIGLNDTLKTYPKQIEMKLNNKIDIYNFGVPGANILDIFWVYKYKVLQFKPKLIIYAYYWNDIEFIKNTKMQPDNTNIEYCSTIFKSDSIKFIDFIEYRFDNIIKKMQNRYKIDTMYYLRNPNFMSDKYIGFRCLKKVLNEFNNSEIPFLLFVIPAPHESKEDNLIIEKKIYNISNKIGINFVYNFTEKFYYKLNDSPRNHIISNNDLHYDSYANKIISEILFKYLKEKKIIN